MATRQAKTGYWQTVALLGVMGIAPPLLAQAATTDVDPDVELPATNISAARQDNPADEGHGVVAKQAQTATKSDTALIETPQSVSVVTKEQIARQGANSIPEALRYTASVIPELRGNSSAGAPYLISRGFYLEQFLDGARLPSDSSFGYAVPSFDPYGLERIEVLHGPASVLYGQANPGGVANLVSKKPTTEPLHEVFATTGSHGRVESGFDLGGRLADSDTLSYRLTGVGVDTDTQVDHARQKHLYIAPALTWQPNEDTSLTVMAKYQRDPDVGYYNFVPAVGSLISGSNGKIPTSHYLGDPGFDHHSKTQTSVGYEFEQHLDSVWTLRQNMHYTEVKDELSNVFTNGYASGSNKVLNRYAFFNDENAKFFSVDNQAQARFNTGELAHTALMGVDYQRVLYEEKVGLGGAPALDAFNPIYLPVTRPSTSSDDLIRQRQTGVYAQDQIAYGQWRVLGGVREDWVRSDDDNPVQGTYSEQSERAFSWRTGVVYLFDNGLAPYFSVAKSFDPQAATRYDGSAAKPTTAKQYELGIKYQPPGSDSFVTAAVFDLKEQNVLTSDPLHPGFSNQAGEVSARGIELEGHANLTHDLALIGSYTYLRNITTDSNDSTTTVDGTTTSLQGKHPWGIPSHVASTWLDYTVHEGTLNGLGFGAGVRYLGASYDQSNSLRVPSVTLADASVHYDTGQHWLLTVTAKNLLDRRYVSSCFNSNICTYGDRGEVLASASYRW
ncbi:TonB-dependent siderophore receptor [Pseudomonas sp. 7P_10.2_Bac1]|uniref:TonB-dependent siderophore receptor n=1 Tax=Pseudomonas sp. 7P_10.2_Bac1 TaxID=2971614 RepID=UPI0021CA8F5C|nr:TonB-dependent siderophore receptor [Pseudomonas sp. 7P_10.2_Bac1]MCU1726002.1 TonB-dependent siderophore receptor [Pseudomonas sp. 7P_10.2_Bac1]